MVARAAIGRLEALARPAHAFDASRYFRAGTNLVFYNVRTPIVRGLARSIEHAVRGRWAVDQAMAFADALMPHPALEVKGLAIDVVARYRRSFRPSMLGAWKRWLARSLAANWATTDALCGSLVGPLLLDHPGLAPALRGWARHRNLWIRRASAVSLIPSVRRGRHLDLAFEIASSLHDDREDLIQKAVGWLLREAGKTQPQRLLVYLDANGPRMPRTTVRYAIERFPPSTRRRLLELTRARKPQPPNGSGLRP